MPIYKTNLNIQSLGILISLIALITIISIATPHFLTADNVLSVIRSFSFVAIMAIGEMIVIITAGIDLSVGSIMGFSACLTALLIHSGWGSPLAIVIGMITGLLLGFANGVLITRLKLPPFIVTLGMLSICRGLTYVITKGWPISGFSEQFMFLGQGKLWLIPFPIFIMVIFALAGGVFLYKTIWGRQIYAIGGNEEATRLSGVNVDNVKVLAYMISGFTAAVAGILLIARLGVAQPTAGLSYELDVIAAAVIGGTSLMGGEGTILGLIIGAAIMGVLRNGLVLLGVSAFWQQVALGAVIILAVTIDKIRK
ncbi:ABC transporter permease [candidate division KSB1 bacterium]|nr:ABC transporter permease [candidate division KSB1 bacterium]